MGAFVFKGRSCFKVREHEISRYYAGVVAPKSFGPWNIIDWLRSMISMIFERAHRGHTHKERHILNFSFSSSFPSVGSLGYILETMVTYDELTCFLYARRGHVPFDTCTHTLTVDRSHLLLHLHEMHATQGTTGNSAIHTQKSRHVEKILTPH